VKIGSVLAIYFIVWWTVLFAILPFGVRSQAEAGDVDPGTDPGAPTRPFLMRKVVATTLVAAIVTFGLFYIVMNGILTLEDFPMPFSTSDE
jgi:predicted secreted protein